MKSLSVLFIYVAPNHKDAAELERKTQEMLWEQQREKTPPVIIVQNVNR